NRLEFASRPASHHEVVVARAFAGVVDEKVRFGQKKLPVRWINFRGAGERESAPIGCNALSKNGLALLAILGRLPFANVENQDTRTAERPRKRVKHRDTC